MGIGERHRSEGASDISRFLAEHQNCDAGFDVRRQEDPRRGRFTITCLGCGGSLSHMAAHFGDLIAFDAELDSSIPVENGAGHRHPGASEPARSSAAAKTEGAQKPARTRPRGLLIAGGALAATGLIAAALLASGGDDGGPATAPPAEGPVAQPPAEAPASPRPAQQPVDLERQSFVDRFSIGTPGGWDSEFADGGIELAPPSGEAAVEVYFEQGETSTRDLARSARDYLSVRHEDASLSAPRVVDLGGTSGLTVRADYRGGAEEAIVVAFSGYAYLVLKRIDGGAAPRITRQADAVAASFRPL
jgi:hypothetical protein